MMTTEQEMEGYKSDILTVNTIKRFMPSCIIFAFVQGMTFMVDTLLAGHFLDADNVAAITMGLPTIGIMASLTAMILQGGYLKMLGYLGKSDMDGYNRMFSITLSMTILVDLVLVLLCFLLRMPWF